MRVMFSTADFFLFLLWGVLSLVKLWIVWQSKCLINLSFQNSKKRISHDFILCSVFVVLIGNFLCIIYIFFSICKSCNHDRNFCQIVFLIFSGNVFFIIYFIMLNYSTITGGKGVSPSRCSQLHQMSLL